MADFPKYQISKFHGEDRNIQEVFRTDDKEEYMKMREEWGKLAPVVAIPATSAPATYMTPTQALGNCKKCGAPNKISKAGKVYCSNTCWLKQPKEQPPINEW